MELYTEPILIAVGIFPVLALVLTLPYMLYSYRKYGAVSILRSLVLFSFLFYLMCAYFLVILPLPDPDAVARMTSPTMELVPFTFVKSFLTDSPFVLSDPSTYLPSLRSHAFLEPFFNIVLTLPFGVYLSYYFRENLLKTVLATFLLSLFFELTQLTGLYGLYPRPYRLFAVDDLMLNTLGGALGYSLGVAVRHILPSKSRIDQGSYQRSRKVGYMRRLTADGIDMVLLFFLTPLAGQLAGPSPYIFPALFLLYFAGLQTAAGGRTLGKLLVHLRVEKTAGRLPLFWWMLLRYLLILCPFWAAVLLWPVADGGLQLVLLLWVPALMALYFFSWLAGFFRDKRLWYEALSRTRLASTFAPKPPKNEP